MPRVLLAPIRPLDNSSDSASLAAGVTETLASALSHFEEFDLVDPSAARDAISQLGAKKAGAQLGATYVLEGSLQCALGKARIGVQLIDVSSDERVWSETRDYGLEDAFALQDDITGFVASTLGEAVGEEQARVIAHRDSSELRGYELLIRGIQQLHRLSPENNLEARQCFERLLADEPDHYFPTLCLCWTYAAELANGWPPTRDDALDYALDLMRGVLKHHDRSAHAHRLIGRLLMCAGDHEQSVAHCERANRLNPYHTDMMSSLGYALVWAGQAEEGLIKLRRALSINPYAPPYYKAYAALASFLAGRYEEALDLLKTIEGSIGPSQIALIASLAALDRVEEAREEAGKLLRQDPGFDLGGLLAAYPFKLAEDRTRLGDALRLAGLDAVQRNAAT